MGTTVSEKRTGILVSFILCLFTSFPALAAETRQLALPQVLEMSLQNNGDLKAFREEQGIRDAARIRAGLLPNPTLDVEVATGVLTGSKHDNSLALGVSQEFFLAGKRDKRLTIAERDLEAYRWQLADRERMLREEVKSAFYIALLARERSALAHRSIALNRQLLDVAKERLAAGDIPELELNLVKVELARSEGVSIELAKAIVQSESRLWALMGGAAGTQPAIEGKLESGTSATKTLTELKQLARASRPDIKSLGAENSRGEADIALARAESIPNLTAGLVLRRDTTAMEIGGVEGKDTAYTIGVRLSMPIPVFDRNQTGIQEALAKKSISETRLQTAVNTMEREIEDAYVAFQNATSVLALYKSDILPQLEENLKLTHEAYRLGEVGILSVIQEQKKYFEVSDGYLTALHDRQSALIKLESVTASELTGGEK